MRTFRGPAIVALRGRPSLCLAVQEPMLLLRFEGVNRCALAIDSSQIHLRRAPQPFFPSDLRMYPIMISFITRNRNIRKSARCAAKPDASSNLTTSRSEADQIWTRDFALHPRTSPADQDHGVQKAERLEAAVGEKLGCR